LFVIYVSISRYFLISALSLLVSVFSSIVATWSLLYGCRWIGIWLTLMTFDFGCMAWQICCQHGSSSFEMSFEIVLFGKCLVLNMHGDIIFALCMCPDNHGVLINSMILYVLLMFVLMLIAHTASCTPWCTALKMICKIVFNWS
jgi:hypothetical protein